ncbi:MAG: c-type cytochrome [Smithellaceae bacterium]|nr:c-type cytochrome [Smithellaceae bacterium]
MRKEYVLIAAILLCLAVFAAGGAAGNFPKAALLNGDRGRGAALFTNICSRCHGPMGTDHVLNPGSADGTVPPLGPIDRALFSRDPDTFATRIDPFLQHGSAPEGPNPSLRMLPFGDSGTLSQAQIADAEAYVMGLNGVDRSPIRSLLLAAVSYVILAAALWIAICAALLTQRGKLKR